MAILFLVVSLWPLRVRAAVKVLDLNTLVWGTLYRNPEVVKAGLEKLRNLGSGVDGSVYKELEAHFYPEMRSWNIESYPGAKLRVTRSLGELSQGELLRYFFSLLDETAVFARDLSGKKGFEEIFRPGLVQALKDLDFNDRARVVDLIRSMQDFVGDKRARPHAPPSPATHSD